MHNLDSSYPFHNHVNWQLPKQIKQTWKQKINKIKKTGRLRKGLLWYIPFPFILFMIANDQLPRWQEMWRGVWHRPETHTIHTHINTFKEIHTQWHIKSKAEITHMVKHTHTQRGVINIWWVVCAGIPPCCLYQQQVHRWGVQLLDGSQWEYSTTVMDKEGFFQLTDCEGSRWFICWRLSHLHDHQKRVTQ